MSVIIGRALPDVRDGLKPAHRRVLYGMKQMGLSSTRGYRKCAKIVGEVMGNYHPARRRVDLRHAGPHGAGLQHARTCSSTARATSARSTAIRRRRCGTPRRRLEALADEMMADLDKETVDFVPNYDETTEEPTVLPAPFPNLLVNGSAGIAVGMATNIPPHNMREVIDAVIWSIESQRRPTRRRRWPSGSASCSSSCPGPDFPTGGYIVGRHGIQQAYLTGRGAVIMRAKAEIEVVEEGRPLVDRHHRDSLSGQQGAADRAHRRPGAREDHRGHLRHPRRVRSRRHAHRHRPEARRGRRGRPQQPLQAHAAAEQLRHHHAGDRRRPPEGAVAGRAASTTSSSSAARSCAGAPSSSCARPKRGATSSKGLKIALDHLDAVIALIRAAKNPAEAREGLMTQFGAVARSRRRRSSTCSCSA